MNRRFSLSKAITEAAYGNLTGVEAEFNQTAHNEARSSGVTLEGNFAIPNMALRADAPGYFGATDTTTAGDGTNTSTGSEMVPTNVGPMIEQLRPAPLVERMGATVLNGLSGDTVLPRASSFDSAVAVEGAAVALDGLIDSITLSPYRVGGQGIYSKRLLVQGGPDVDRMIASEMGRAITEAIDRICIEGAAASNEPLGLNQTGQHTDVTATANATDAQQIAALLADAEGAYIGQGGDPNAAVVLMGPKAHAAARQAALIDSVASLYDQGGQGMQIFGRPVFVSKHVTDTDAAPEFYYLDPRTIVLGFFGSGAIDFVADPYTNGSKAQINLYAHRFFDTDVRHAGLVHYCSDTLD